MELAGEELIGAPRNEVWAALTDEAMLLRCIPGCESVERVSEHELHARVAVKVGPVRARFAGRIQFSDVVEPAACTLVFEGSGGAAGFAKGCSAVTLAEEAEGTRVSYTTSASIGGKLGQVGGRLIDSSARKMADDFFGALREAMSGAPESAVPSASVESQSPAPAVAPARESHAAPAGLRPEIIRAFWFLLGALCALLACQFLN